MKLRLCEHNLSEDVAFEMGLIRSQPGEGLVEVGGAGGH